MKGSRSLVGCVAVLFLVTGCLEEASTKASDAPVPEVTRAVEPVVTLAPTRAPSAPTPVGLLFAAKGGDGDSWKDRAGREYRLGLVNTPELGECYGQAASDKRKQLVRPGFRAQTYATDSHGRSVAVVTLVDGRNLNVLLARTGYADDRYLEEFRSENPALARQLDAAFAAAKAERVGLWRACSSSTPAPSKAPVAAPGARGSCDAAYPDVCIPSPEPDLDCGDITFRRFRVLAPDPHRFDSDHNGIGCESG